jgi:hypothetical protein
MTIAAYVVFALPKNKLHSSNEEEGVNVKELVQVVLPYCLYPSSFVRTVAQIICHNALPLCLEDSDTKNDSSSSSNSSDVTLKGIYSFLEENSDIVKLRKKQSQFVKRLEPVAYCRVGEMLSHSDDFQEVNL